MILCEGSRDWFYCLWLIFVFACSSGSRFSVMGPLLAGEVAKETEATYMYTKELGMLQCRS